MEEAPFAFNWNIETFTRWKSSLDIATFGQSLPITKLTFLYHTTSVFSCISFLNAPDDKKPGIPVKNMSNCSNKTFVIYSWRLIFSKKSNFMGLFWVSQYFQMPHKFEHIRSPVIKCWRDPIIVSSVRKNKSVRKRRDPSPLRMEPGSLCCRAFIVTRSCAALRAADLGLSGQDAFRARTFGRLPVSLFSPLELSSNWILILIQL